LLVTSPKCADEVRGLVTSAPGEPEFFMLDEPQRGFRSWDKEAIAQPVTPIPDEVAGYDMLSPKASRRNSRARGSMLRIRSC